MRSASEPGAEILPRRTGACPVRRPCCALDAATRTRSQRRLRARAWNHCSRGGVAFRSRGFATHRERTRIISAIARWRNSHRTNRRFARWTSQRLEQFYATSLLGNFLQHGPSAIAAAFPPKARALSAMAQAFVKSIGRSMRPIPWKAKECVRAGTVHIGGTLEEIAANRNARRGKRARQRPFVLLAQPTLFDPRARPPASTSPGPTATSQRFELRHERPHRSTSREVRAGLPPDRAEAPRELAADLESHNPNLVGGDITGGASLLSQLFLRPTGGSIALL